MQADGTDGAFQQAPPALLHGLQLDLQETDGQLCVLLRWYVESLGEFGDRVPHVRHVAPHEPLRRVVDHQVNQLQVVRERIGCRCPPA